MLLAAYPVGAAERVHELLATGGAAALLTLLLALGAGWPSAIPWTLALLGGTYATGLAVRDDATLDAGAPLYAAGLLLLAELAYWSLELRGPGREEPRVVVRRLAALGALAFLSLVLGAFVVVVTTAPIGGGVLWDVVGVAAAAATLAILARLARGAAAS